MPRPLTLHVATAIACLVALIAAPAAQARTLLDAAQTDLETATVVAPSKTAPGWVQAVYASVPVYTADSGSDVALNVPRHTFLRVVTVGASRLQVQAYDENGNPTQTGWVEANQVLPSAPGINWLVASTTTPLFNSASSNDVGRSIPRFTPLQQLDGPTDLGRVQVRVYRTDFSGVVDQGWVDAANIGPALAPQVRVPSLTDQPAGLRSVTASTQQQAFLDATAQPARDAMALTGVPASVTVAQAILESDWGRSALAVDANNYFGMKAMGTLGSAGVVYMQTSEYDSSGELYQVVDAFRAYNSLTDSLADHDRLLQTASRYAAAMKAAGDPRQFATLLQQEGYSTDPAYASKLIALMDRYNLYQLDA